MKTFNVYNDSQWKHLQFTGEAGVCYSNTFLWLPLKYDWSECLARMYADPLCTHEITYVDASTMYLLPSASNVIGNGYVEADCHTWVEWVLIYPCVLLYFFLMVVCMIGIIIAFANTEVGKRYCFCLRERSYE